MISLRSRLRSWHIVLALIVIAGMGLRLAYLLHVSPWTDEYYTMLAVKMTAEKGIPLLPSGWLYNKGLPFIYSSAALAWLFKFGLTVSRLPSLIISLPALLLIFHVGQRWFNRRVGLVAALLLGLAPEAVAWGGQARMYALWQFCTLAAIYFLYEGLLRGGSRAVRVSGLLALAAAMLCHLRTLLTLPVLILGLVAAAWIGRKQEQVQVWRPKGVPWTELAALVLVVASLYISFVGQAPEGSGSWDPAEALAWLNPLKMFADVVIGAMQFLIQPYLIVTVPALAGMLGLCLRLLRSKPERQDPILLFLGIIVLGVVVEFSFVSPAVIQVPRYVFDILPLYFLVVAHELDFFARSIADQLKGVPATAMGWAPLAFVLALFTGPSLSSVTGQVSALQPALEYVGEQWRPGDKIGAQQPVPAYLVLGRCDYFVALDYPFVWERGEGSVDPHLGLPSIDTAEGLRRIAGESPRLWLVVEERYAGPYEEILGDQAVAAFRKQNLVERQR